MESGTLVKSLALARAQTDTHLDTPNLAGLGGTVTLGTLARGEDNLLGALNLVVVKEPRGGALNEVAVVGLADLLKESGDLGLSRALLGSSLGLLLLSALGKEARGNHEAEEDLVGVVGSEDQVSRAASDLLVGAGKDGVADNSTEAIDLSTKLDLDGLSGLDLLVGLSLVGGEGSVGSDIGSGGDGGGMGETFGFFVSARTSALGWYVSGSLPLLIFLPL